MEMEKVRRANVAVKNYALHCGIKSVERWAVSWLAGTNRTEGSAIAARSAAIARAEWAAEEEARASAAEWAIARAEWAEAEEWAAAEAARAEAARAGL